MSCKMSPTATTSRALLVEEQSVSSFSLASLASTISQDESFKCREHAENTLKRMKSYLETEQLCDVTLISALDGKK
jgi:hypothetical protein